MNVYLMGWSGDRLIDDRITRDGVDIPSVLITVAITVQPAALESLYSNVVLAGRDFCRFCSSVAGVGVWNRLIVLRVGI